MRTDKADTDTDTVTDTDTDTDSDTDDALYSLLFSSLTMDDFFGSVSSQVSQLDDIFDTPGRRKLGTVVGVSIRR